jgi:hypothetical protein
LNPINPKNHFAATSYVIADGVINEHNGHSEIQKSIKASNV